MFIVLAMVASGVAGYFLGAMFGLLGVVFAFPIGMAFGFVGMMLQNRWSLR